MRLVVPVTVKLAPVEFWYCVLSPTRKVKPDVVVTGSEPLELEHEDSTTTKHIAQTIDPMRAEKRETIIEQKENRVKQKKQKSTKQNGIET